MNAARHLLARRHFALLICGVALLLKLLVPAGYMLGSNQGTIAVTVCSGVVSKSTARVVPRMGDEMTVTFGHGNPYEQGHGEMPCAYSGLAAPPLASVDAVLLLAALAAVATLTLCAVPGSTARIVPYLRPPLRGPPPQD